MLPPEQQGKAIADGPLPFMFGAEAEKLKRRYFLRRVAPPKGRTDLICLEAYPRYQADAAQFSRIDLDLTANDLLPVGMQTYLPGRNGRFSFQFYNRKVNHFNPLEAIFGQGWFKASTPAGWRKDVKQPPQVQVSQQPPPRGNQPRRTVRR